MAAVAGSLRGLPLSMVVSESMPATPESMNWFTQGLCFVAWCAFGAGVFQQLGMPTSGVGDRGIWLLAICACVSALTRKGRLPHCPQLVAGSIAILTGLGSWLFLFSSPSMDDLEAQGTEIVGSVEASMKPTGLYPSTLEEAGIRIPWSRYAWEYSTSNGRRKFRLSVGKYGRDGFRMSFDSDSGRWRRDT